mmetsp:Transcript_57575/g.134906  ORF Transcript_57575/g.134906 Transcript_57575/m.134906 type:complete len:239 (-) Transcript_57575:630-1346(-)
MKIVNGIESTFSAQGQRQRTLVLAVGGIPIDLLLLDWQARFGFSRHCLQHLPHTNQIPFVESNLRIQRINGVHANVAGPKLIHQALAITLSSPENLQKGIAAHNLANDLHSSGRSQVDQESWSLKSLQGMETAWAQGLAVKDLGELELSNAHLTTMTWHFSFKVNQEHSPKKFASVYEALHQPLQSLKGLNRRRRDRIHKLVLRKNQEGTTERTPQHERLQELEHLWTFLLTSQLQKE